MTVDDLRELLRGLPGGLPVAVAVLEPCGHDIEPNRATAAGVTFHLTDPDHGINPDVVWITAVPTDELEYPAQADYRCPCGQLMRYHHGDHRDRHHDHCDIDLTIDED